MDMGVQQGPHRQECAGGEASPAPRGRPGRRGAGRLSGRLPQGGEGAPGRAPSITRIACSAHLSPPTHSFRSRAAGRPPEVAALREFRARWMSAPSNQSRGIHPCRRSAS